MTCVSQEALKDYTGKDRPSAQARFLRARFPKMLVIERDDGTLAIRQEEFDRYTLSKLPEMKRRRALDLSLLRKAG